MGFPEPRKRNHDSAGGESEGEETTSLGDSSTTQDYSPKCKKKKKHAARVAGVEVPETWARAIIKHAPKLILVAFVIALVVAVIYDWRTIIQMFQKLILWVKDEPYKSMATLFFVYVLLIIFSMPFAFLTVPIGYAFHEAFEGSLSNRIPYHHFSRVHLRFSDTLRRHHGGRHMRLLPQ